MKLKTLLLSLFCISTLFSGEVQFDLSEYEPIEYRYLEFSLYPRFNSGYNASEDIKQAIQNLSINIPLSFRVNKKKRILNLNFHNEVYINTLHLNYSDTSKYSPKSIESIHALTFDHRRYIRPEKFFLEHQYGIAFFQDQIKGEHPFKKTTDDVSSNRSFGFGLGYGRIKDVTYPSVSLLLLQKLQEEDVTLNINKSKIQKTSALFEKLKNRRFWDTRLKRMSDIEEIAGHLTSEQLCKPLSPCNTMLILDYWEYAFHQKRYSGFEVVLSVYNTDTRNNIIYNWNVDSLLHNQYLPLFFRFYDAYSILKAEIDLYKTSSPTKMKHLHASFYITSFEETRKYVQHPNATNGFYINNEENDVLTLTVTPSLSLYPSIRTTIGVENTLSLTSHLLENKNTISNTSTGSIEYFVSPQFSYGGEINASLYIDSRDKIIFNASVKANITYHIR